MVEFFFDFSSPWTYVGFENIARLSAEVRIQIVWKPFLLGAVFNEINPSVYKSRQQPIKAKDAYFKKDLADWARDLGLGIIFPPAVFPVNSAAALRGCFVADSYQRLETYMRAVFEAYWRDDRDISDLSVLANIATGSGLPAREFRDRVGSDELKSRLRSNTAELVCRGGFGSPTMFLERNDMYFGNDRIEMLRRAVARHRKPAT